MNLLLLVLSLFLVLFAAVCYYRRITCIHIDTYTQTGFDPLHRWVYQVLTALLFTFAVVQLLFELINMHSYEDWVIIFRCGVFAANVIVAASLSLVTVQTHGALSLARRHVQDAKKYTHYK